ncbi:chloride channel protein [Kaistia dalseonensis]|uniref:CIC family chloride channel protein n=1 Tax=Kaistia dalseonensis TaxID=410840 RepID=A0ABU0H4Q0_9HYPH|nr:chloride channel protein [Kaistia dalseonensis]MCX5494156.1 chloride channel protein [Kaistia dalseonensis]MDQ0436735.1 CIC family chloride channel protein [Kaistia dalseonensis]
MPLAEPIDRIAVRLRTLIRSREPSLLVVAAFIGAISGTVVTLVSWAAQALHVLLFAIQPDVRLSAASVIEPAWRCAAPVLGGVVLGLVLLAFARRSRPIVDPIEANALHGGRMSLPDSLRVGLENVISNGFGASVGLEAGYTQVASGIASAIGERLRLRRADLRLAVGCGSAAAIAAAFAAPLTGAFYGFELIIGVYSVATVAPVMIAAITGFLVAQALGAAAYPIEIAKTAEFLPSDYPPYLLIGLLLGFAAIGIMRLVTLVELAFQKSRLPRYVRPTIGGVAVGLMALITPQVLAAGHGALHLSLNETLPARMLVMLLVLKIAATSISIGSGFRGGMFFASLFLGVLFGKLIGLTIAIALPDWSIDPQAAAIVGMSALSVGIVGGPLTMTFLALESTGNLGLTGVVLAASILSALTVRQFFGYSFSTWRLHLRGETIRGAQDIGWQRDLTVGRMMRTDVRSILTTMPVDAFRNLFPLGSTQRVIATDTSGRYAGIVLVADVHAKAQADDGDGTIAPFCQHSDRVLLAQMSAREAAAAFDEAESEELAVVDDDDHRHVIGLLTETHLLRRYAEEVDKARRNLAGEN